MKVLGICGSHREKSTTLFFLKKALMVCEKAGLETEAITLHEKDIKPCIVCDLCKKKYDCSINDDMASIRRLMESADAIIIASPSYYACVSGKTKNMFDRSLPLRRNGYKLSNKIGGAISVGASRNGGQEIVCKQILTWFGLQEMIAVTDKKTAHFGGIGWVPRGKAPEDDGIGIETCENLGTKVVEVLSLVKK
jgi:multimeric flavodoxin WrbA